MKLISLPPIIRKRFGHPALALVLTGGMLVSSAPAAKPNKLEREAAGEASGDLTAAKPKKRDARTDAKGDAADAANGESKTLTRLREQLEVLDDAEWTVIAERINQLEELRRGSGAAGTRGRGGLAPGLRVKRNGSSASGRPEEDALRVAVNDKLPEAEIKARLARVHTVQAEGEAKKIAAQEALRAVLTLRQEAVAVLAGVLPP